MADLEQRVGVLERIVAALQERLDMEAGLAAARDRDTSDVLTRLRAQELSLIALRETQIEHGRRLNGIDGQLEVLTKGQQALTAGQQALAAGQQSLAAGQQTIVTMLTTLINRE